MYAGQNCDASEMLKQQANLLQQHLIKTCESYDEVTMKNAANNAATSAGFAANPTLADTANREGDVVIPDYATLLQEVTALSEEIAEHSQQAQATYQEIYEEFLKLTQEHEELSAYFQRVKKLPTT